MITFKSPSPLFLEIPLMGETRVQKDFIDSCFGDDAFISEWNGEFKFESPNINLKVSISEEDAKWMIDRLKLVKYQSGCFNNSFIYKK